jgi:hypothetical protein
MSSKIEDRIREIAEAFVEQSQAKADRLKAELIEAQQRVAKLTAELNAARLAPKRLQDFAAHVSLGAGACRHGGDEREVSVGVTEASIIQHLPWFRAVGERVLDRFVE